MADEVPLSDDKGGWALAGYVEDATEETRIVKDTQPLPVTISATSGASATPSAGGSGAKTVTTAGTAETLAASTTCRAVKISNPDTNTGPAAWGFDANVEAAGATLDGCQIAVGGTSGWIAIDNLSKIYVDVAANGENLGYVYLV